MRSQWMRGGRWPRFAGQQSLPLSGQCRSATSWCAIAQAAPATYLADRGSSLYAPNERPFEPVIHRFASQRRAAAVRLKPQPSMISGSGRPQVCRRLGPVVCADPPGHRPPASANCDSSPNLASLEPATTASPDDDAAGWHPGDHGRVLLLALEASSRLGTFQRATSIPSAAGVPRRSAPAIAVRGNRSPPTARPSRAHLRPSSRPGASDRCDHLVANSVVGDQRPELVEAIVGLPGRCHPGRVRRIGAADVESVGECSRAPVRRGPTTLVPNIQKATGRIRRIGETLPV